MQGQMIIVLAGLATIALLSDSPGGMAAVVLLSLLAVCAHRYRVTFCFGDSMSPCLLDRDVILTEAIAIKSVLRCGDVITFKIDPAVVALIPDSYILERWGMLAKRIVGLPGDLVEINENGIFVNQKRLDADCFNSSKPGYTLRMLQDIGGGSYRPHAGNTQPVVVPRDQYFVLGDNHGIINLDSHIFGFVEKTKIESRVIAVIGRDGFPCLRAVS